ncbi:malate dehydrogenase [Mesorhizobium sp. B3-1-3]|uniref:Ldh family oxidoreductase n=1 Tax=unclassified Mesorhizobium TaxID=325217 RepID=UPI00112655FC|nr:MULTISPECIES: Ldh family oxidoreductase [unclassified Mesorhizobium]TPI56065.1 malate dehydrogenase [Mesorhizobium sp. B3-1-8]TPI63359.1 malate dehydrogenase [Mesorhizobium sp. B3-1-3]
MAKELLVSAEDAEVMATQACLSTGADIRTTRSLVAATLSAAFFGQAPLGFPHLIDYLESFQDGRINKQPDPKITQRFPAFLSSDADQGIAQVGFDLALQRLVEATETYGVAVFTQANSYPAGELGYYIRRLSDFGLNGLAATNANAMVAPKPGGAKVYSTNPMAFGFPTGRGEPPIIIDQSSSAAAFGKIRAASYEGKPIPIGWAVDENGLDTTDPTRAMSGSLLPFGGRKGANVALMVEMLSAGLSGGSWSIDAAHFGVGSECPSIGLTVLAIVSNSRESDRIRDQVKRLQDHGVYVPGVSSATKRAGRPTHVLMPETVLTRLTEIIEGRLR